MRQHNEYCGQLLARNKKRHWEFVCAIINTKTDLKYVKEFLDTKVPEDVNKDKLHAIRLYYTAKTTELSMIEKTMSPAQLFQINSPFWVVGLTITHIQNIQDLYPKVEPDAFFKYFNQLLDDKQYFNTRMMLWHQHRKETE